MCRISLQGVDGEFRLPISLEAIDVSVLWMNKVLLIYNIS